MKSTKLVVKTKSKYYPIFFGNNILNKTGKLVKKNLPNYHLAFAAKEKSALNLLK